MAITKKDTGNIIGMMEEWFAKAPMLPPNIRDVLVKITPVLALVFGVLGVLTALGGLGTLTIFAPVAMMGEGPRMGYGGGYITALCLLISSVLMLMAYPGTKAHKLQGWELLFWSEAVMLVSSVFSYNIVGGIIGAAIGFYLLFQIKPAYK